MALCMILGISYFNKSTTMDFSEDDNTFNTQPRQKKSFSLPLRSLSDIWEEQDRKEAEEERSRSFSELDQRSQDQRSQDQRSYREESDLESSLNAERSPEKSNDSLMSPDQQPARNKIAITENMQSRQVTASEHLAKNIETIGFQALAGDENGMIFFKSPEVQEEMRDNLTANQKRNVITTLSEKVEELYQELKMENQQNSIRYAQDEMLTDSERIQAIRKGNVDVAQKIAIIRKNISEITQPLCNEQQRILETFDRTPDTLLLNFIDFSEFTFDPTESIEQTMKKLIKNQRLKVPLYQDNDSTTQIPGKLLGKRLFDQQLKDAIIDYYAKEYGSKIPVDATFQEIVRYIPDFAQFAPELKTAIIQHHMTNISENSAAIVNKSALLIGNNE